MNRSRKTFVVLMSAASLALVTSTGTGCRPKKQPPAQQPFESPVISDQGQRMSELQRSAQDLSGIVRQLPGRDARQDRQLLAQAFDATHQALSMMGGTEPGGALRQQLRTIENVRQFLRSADEKLSYEPSVDQGLRATYNALDGVRARLFPNDATVRTQLNAFAERLPELDQVRGPLHAVVVADVFRSAATAVGTMGNILNARQQMIAQPTYQPAPAPTPGYIPAAAAPAAPAAATAPPAPPVAPPPQYTRPQPPPAPAPAAPAAPAGQPTPQQYEQLRRQNEELRRQLQQLQQQQQQQPPVAPAPSGGGNK